MKPDASKNQKLIKQYPFVTSIMDMRLAPIDGDGKNHRVVSDLTIKVQKADGDLMYRVADNIGLYENSYIMSSSVSRSDQVMKQGEYLLAIDHRNKPINILMWPSKSFNVYGHNVLWNNTSDDGSMQSDSIHDITKCLVWVTVSAWYKHMPESDYPFGEFVDRILDITIYQKPAIGFKKLEEISNIYENLHLSTRILTSGVLRKDYDLITIGGRLDELCNLFGEDVYFNGMKQILDDGKVRGASGTFNSVEVLVGELCGYDRIMLQNGNAWISFQLRPESRQLYVLGVGGTLTQVRNLVRTVTKAWIEKPENRDNFKPNKEIRIL